VSALGVTSILWTYDPLMAANAHFNINRLRARPIEYVPDMYGSNTGSTLHGALPTDRFIVRWAPGEPLPQPSAGKAAVPPSLVNPLAADEGPTEWSEPSPTAPAYRVQIPADWDAVRSEGGERARRWRSVVRDAVTTLLAHGYRVDAFDRGTEDHLPSYRFVRGEAPAR
jgi:predicted GNAT superfamily acetyltransferase